MEILFCCSELAPAVKVGGLADVVFGLSKALKNLGHHVTVALPRYPVLERSGILLARRLTPMPLPAHPGEPPAPPGYPTEVTLYDGRLGSGVDIVAFDAESPKGGSLYAGVETEDGAGIYEGASGVPGALRFGTFDRAVVELVRRRATAGQPFDVVHLHDWPAAMVAYLMRLHPQLDATATVLTIHNIAHQGVFEGEAIRAALAALGLSDAHFVPAKLEFYGGISLLKGGVVSADAVTTVSDSYAREILTPGHGERLDGVLLARGEPPVGIVNGVDYSVYNPATDPTLIARYDADDPSNKGRCKSALLSDLELEIDPERPLFVSLGRVVHQKGTDVLAEAARKMLNSDLSLVVAGTGDADIEKALTAALARAPERAKFLGRVNESVAHRLLAAADFVVLPSRYEPCGLVQVHAQRYGALPIASRTGGFIDTIVDLDASLETGTGFLFPVTEGPTPENLLGAAGRALSAYVHPRFGAVRRRVMRLDVGWERPARRYVQLYKQVS
jgi:starch synthase